MLKTLKKRYWYCKDCKTWPLNDWYWYYSRLKKKYFPNALCTSVFRAMSNIYKVTIIWNQLIVKSPSLLSQRTSIMAVWQVLNTSLGNQYLESHYSFRMPVWQIIPPCTHFTQSLKFSRHLIAIIIYLYGSSFRNIGNSSTYSWLTFPTTPKHWQI